MEIIFGCLIIIGVIVFFQLLRTKNFDQPVSSWSDDELARRLVNYERISSIAASQAVSGNLDSMTKHTEAGNKAKEIRDEIARRRSSQLEKGYQRSSVTKKGEIIDVGTIAKADAGDTNSQFLVGSAYLSGANGLPQDAKKAIEYLRKAADVEHPHAAFALGCVYADGIGVTQNLDYARNWASKAQSLGVIRAADLLLAICAKKVDQPYAPTDR